MIAPDRMDMQSGRTCVTCFHNTYRGIAGCEWISCCHPVTIAKTPRPVNGDPAWVDLMASDHRISQIGDIPECDAWCAAKGGAA